MRQNTPKFYIYGELNKQVLPQIYEGKETPTANTIIDNSTNTIYTTVLKTPYPLTLKDSDGEIDFDGSEGIVVDLSDYVPKKEAITKLKKEGNSLIVYNALGEIVGTIDLTIENGNI